MGLAVVNSRTLRGLRAPEVRVEVHLSDGLPQFAIVGLPEAAVRESRERVRAAIQQSGFDFPQRRITVNLAPADLPKDSGRFDLPIAIGILCAHGRLPMAPLGELELLGELSLAGVLRPIAGTLALACGLVFERSGRSLIVPAGNAREAALSGHPRVLGAVDLGQVCRHLRGEPVLVAVPPGADGIATGQPPEPDLADVVGQPLGKRALEIAAAGRHHLLLVGPPGTGKSMLAERLAGLLPDLPTSEALEVASIASLRLQPPTALPRRSPMRSPHHSTSVAGLLGGGMPPKPGEISLAHHGILFLDELPEFARGAIEALREPLETGRVTISRGPYQETFPASFLLVAAMNPCPCGYLGDRRRDCLCTPERIRRYRARLSGPLLDRFDLSVDVGDASAARDDRPTVTVAPAAARTAAREALPAASPPAGSAVVRRRVAQARTVQLGRQGRPNGLLGATDLDRCLGLTADGDRLARQAMARFGWSMRALHRVFKVARTIADLGGHERVDADAVAEAIALRRNLHPTTAGHAGAGHPSAAAG